jgi:hypothetical protein
MAKKMNIRMAVVLLLLGSLTPHLSNAQYVELDSAYTGPKNTIFLLGNPIIVPLMSGSPSSVYLGMVYKRVLKNNKRLKFGLNYDYNDLSPFNQGSDPNNFLAYNDSQVVISNRQEYFSRISLRGGLEWSDYTENNGKFYGLDLHAGISKATHDAYAYTYNRLPGDTTTIGPSDFSILPDTTVAQYDYDHYFLNVGFAANIGYRVVLKKKWEINFTFSPEFTFNFPVRYDWNLATPVPLQYEPSSGFEMQLRMLLVDIGYRF